MAPSTHVSSTLAPAVAPLPHAVDSKHIMGGNIIDLVQPLSQKPPTSGEPKGRNLSGRTWKARPQKRASSLVKTSVNNQSRVWKERQAETLAKKQAADLQKQLQEERRQAAVEKKERRLENERRRAENELKNIAKSVQTLNYNTANLKLKAMSKKQLRQIKKTRVNTKTGVVEYVPAYAK